MLPVAPELLILVIHHVHDDYTLESLFEAFEKYPILQDTALRKRWMHVSLDRMDLLIQPHDCATDEHQTKSEGLIAAITKELSRSMIEPAPTPASYIRFLSFDLRFNPVMRNASRSSCQGKIAFEDIVYTFATVLPQMRHLTRLDIDGIVHQEQLDLIASIDLPSLRSLKLRNSPFFSGSLHPDPALHEMRPVHRDWGNLSKLQQLRILEVGNVHAEECRSLAFAVSKLDHLVKFAVYDWEMYPIHHPNSQSLELVRFVNLAFADTTFNVTGRQSFLPASLKSLVIAQGSPGGMYITSKPAMNEVSLNPPYTEEIYLDLYEPALSTAKILRRNPILKPARLTLPGLSLFKLVVSTTPRPSEVVSYIRDLGTSLVQMTILDIWNLEQFQATQLNTLLGNEYSCHDLVLGTRNYAYYDHYGMRSDKQSLDLDFCGYPSAPEDSDLMVRNRICQQLSTYESQPRWPTSIQRIRIDQTNLSRLKLSTLSSTSFPQLRILVIRPWQIHRFENSNTYYNIALARGVGDPLFFTRNPKMAETVAFNMAYYFVRDENFPRLQVLVIGGHWFWISKDTIPDVESVGYRCWQFSKAEKDPVQSRAIAASLSDRDWCFLKEIPRSPPEEDFGCAGVFLARPAEEMIRRRNYMVFYRHNASEKVQKGQKLRHEGELMDCSAFQDD